MEKALFSISCTTCRARLAVRNKEAIGEILECPKCGSMVLISPPEGWVVTEEAPVTPTTSPSADGPSAEKPLPRSQDDDSGIGRKGTPVARETASKKPAVLPPPIQLPAEAPAAVAAPPALLPTATAPVAPEAAPVQPAAVAAAVPAGFTPFELPEVVAGKTFLSSLTRSFWGRLAVLAVSGLLGLAGVLAVWTVANRRPAVIPKLNGESASPEVAAPLPTGANIKPAPPPAQFNRRWLPEQTLLLIDLRLSRLSKQPSAMNSLACLCPWWQPSNQALLLGLNLGPEQVRRLTWASTDLTDCPAHCVVVVELEEGLDAGRLLPAGEVVDIGANLAARRPQGGPWPHPLLAVDAHTIVTGSRDVLRQLAARGGDAELASGPMELLLKKLSPGGDLAVMVDLSPARTAAWELPAKWLAPAKWLDVWPAGKSRWHLLCETPLAWGLSVPSGDQRRCDLGLVCNGETMAEKIRVVVEKLVPDAIQALPAHIAALKKGVLPPKQLSDEAAGPYKRLLDDLLAALRSARCDTADGIVWVRFDWAAPGLPVSAAAAIESSPVIRADWLAAARIVDETNHRGLLGGLLGCAKAKTPPSFPEGAVGGVLMLPPETRLSWIAELLPYLGHADWHVEPGYDWNGSQNQPVAKRPLAEVVNPIFGPAASPSGYPVTHYVGVAGIGDDAAKLPAGDAKAGIFGYGRQTQQQDLVRGGANTIALLGVEDQCGPWAQGGRATVRPLTRQPYVNGPDGFGSGQADGMMAGMADGSVRFLSKDVDPHVIEQLSTIRGGDQVDMAVLEPKAPESPKPPEADGKPPAVPEPKPPADAKAKPQPVDPLVKAKLNAPIAKISLPDMPLAEAVQLISAMSMLPVSFDLDAMEELGVSLHDPVSIEIADTTVGKTLKEIAAKRNMMPVVENGQILLTSRAEHRESLQTLPVDVSDLTGGDAQAAADLAALLQRLVVPESWQCNGGRGTVETTPGALRVAQTGRVHYRIAVFCEKLRVARGLPAKSSPDAKKFALTTRTDRAKAILDQVVSVNVNVPSPLSNILDQFKQPAGAEILIDRPALAASGISENTAGKFKADRLPQGTALKTLLEPLGLAWRVLDANTFQVTTQKAVAARMELEFYPVKLPGGPPPPAWIEQIKAGLPGAVWGEGGGAIYFDPPSRCLIVLQSQPVQMALEALLAAKAK